MGKGEAISCSLFWESSQVSFFCYYYFFRRLFTDDDESQSVNIKRRFHGLLWKGSARRFEKEGSREAIFLAAVQPLWKTYLVGCGVGGVEGGADWRACLNMKGTQLEANQVNAGG